MAPSQIISMLNCKGTPSDWQCVPRFQPHYACRPPAGRHACLGKDLNVYCVDGLLKIAPTVALVDPPWETNWTVQ
jgi:hypothetical protein